MNAVVDLADVPERFEQWLAGRPLAQRSRREYAPNVRAYCAWLAETPDRDGWQGDPLSDPLARDHAARDFRRHLQVERKAAASTVNLALASLDALYRCLGLGRPNVRREKPVQAAPRALDEGGQRRLLRAAEAAPVRARALVMLMLFTALRISETVALDVDDVRITARKGVLVVLGKGELRREVPLNALVRQVLDEWLEQRKTLARDGECALWVSRTGGRLSARSADRDVVFAQRGAENRLGLAVALCAVRFLGFVPDDPASVPEEALAFVAGQVDAAEHELLAYGGRKQTRSDHVNLLLAHLRWRRATETDRQALGRWLGERAVEHDAPAALMALAGEHLRARRVLRPPIDALARMIATARADAHREVERTPGGPAAAAAPDRARRAPGWRW